MATTTWRVAAAVCALLALAEPGGAQTEEQTIRTDRPGFRTSPWTLPGGALQAEIGLPTIEDEPDVPPSARIDPALRYGITDAIELRLGTSWYVQTPDDADGNGPTGPAGLRAGARFALPVGQTVALSLTPEVVFPVGDEELAGDQASYSLLASAGMPYGDATFVVVGGGNLRPMGGDDYDLSAQLVGVISRSFGNSFWGHVEATALPGEGEVPIYAGIALAWLPTSRIQIDAGADFGLADVATEVVYGAGLSILFD